MLYKITKKTFPVEVEWSGVECPMPHDVSDILAQRSQLNYT